MKKFYCIACFLTAMALIASTVSFSQNDSVRVRNANEDGNVRLPEEKGFKKENLFVGGSATASFYSGGSVLGINPLIGYRLNDYIDAGAALNFVYSGQRDYRVANDKLKQFVYGAGVFARAYPVSFLFAQAQPEYNFISQKYKTADGEGVSKTVTAPSLLLGAGFASGRAKGSTTFFYFSVLFDVLKDRNSPYVNIKHFGTPDERIDMVPVIRAGVNVGLFQGRFNRNRNHERDY